MICLPLEQDASPGISMISVEESLVDSNVTCRSNIVIIDLGCD